MLEGELKRLSLAQRRGTASAVRFDAKNLEDTGWLIRNTDGDGHVTAYNSRKDRDRLRAFGNG
jgi:hypothetical protein